MVPGILGRKVGMTHIFDAEGRMVPVSVIEAGPCHVTQIRTPDKEGYSAVQLGFYDMPERRTVRPMRGHFQKAGVKPKRHLREFRVSDSNEFSLGQVITASEVFSEGDRVRVVGRSKGKGFAGGVKRHHFHGSDEGHGYMTHRRPFSGGATGPARVFKGTKKPGHMGDERVTQFGLKVVSVDKERNLLLVSGAVPGANGGLVVVAREGRRNP